MRTKTILFNWQKLLLRSSFIHVSLSPSLGVWVSEWVSVYECEPLLLVLIVSLSVCLASTFCGHHSQYVSLSIQLKFYRRLVWKFYLGTSQNPNKPNSNQALECVLCLSYFLFISLKNIFMHHIENRERSKWELC